MQTLDQLFVKEDVDLLWTQTVFKLKQIWYQLQTLPINHPLSLLSVVSETSNLKTLFSLY